MASQWAGPLAGVTILDFTRVLAGPFATQILADLGATVIKVESPDGGDLTRGFPPFREGESHYFVSMNHDKKSVVIDLQTPDGVALAKDMVAGVDAVIENFRPGVMDRLGLSYDTLKSINPALIYCAVSGFGLTGPFRDKPSFDLVTQAITGTMSINGELGGEATKLGLPIGDLVGGVYAPVALVSALLERQKTGTGRLIDVSLFDGLFGMLGYFPQLAWMNGEDPKPVGSSHINIVPYGPYPAKDGRIVIACLSDKFWRRLCDALQCEALIEDERFCNMEARKANRDALDEELGSYTQTHTKFELGELLDQYDVPNSPILSVSEALDLDHARDREMVVEVDHQTLGQMPIVGRPVKFAGQEQAPIEAPPTLGQHTDEVLGEMFDIPADKIAQMRKANIIR